MAFLVLAAMLPLASLPFIGWVDLYGPAAVHFTVVVATASVCTAAALGLTFIGARRGDDRAVLAGGAFSIMAAFLGVHGLATPGVLLGPNGLVSLAGGASLPVGGAMLALSALPALRRPERVPALLALQVAGLLVIAALTGVVAVFPGLIPSVPTPLSGAALVTLAVGLALYGTLALRTLRTYALTRRRTDLLVALGVAWLATGLVCAMVVSAGHLGFWLGHALELAGIACVGAPVVADLRRPAPSRPLVGDLRAADLVLDAEAYLGPDVQALLGRLVEKDASTDQHTRRVALRAAQVGDELGLPRRVLRTLAVGGLLHDIGKLSVPDAILKKPGALSTEEFQAIRRHPAAGHELLGRIGSYSEDVRRLVRDHHERLDGRGYPLGITGEQINLDTRILTVCDVYDALVSERVYREAWTPERALALLHAEVGAAFDGRCVAALERVVRRSGDYVETRAA